ncbi:MAG TPA: Gfo/Idh/MocA family oxidoreductase [Pyrinomonadaceae bacterium]|nr:Gfo/Idh/MocA family oxidoreductase [Pyrinomonadaceae bacterium]
MSKAEDYSLRTNQSSRREFVKTSTLVAAGTALAAGLPVVPGAYAQGSDAINVGLIGCGGRGTGAALNVLNAAQGVKLVAMADAFQDHLDDSLKKIKAEKAAQVDVPKERAFVGLDAYQKLLALPEVNYVILATPPGFRPPHIEAAVAAGKHIFTEKPVAVDGPGIRKVLAAYEAAKAKNLGIGMGLQRRHQTGYLEIMKRVHDGAIGDIVGGRAYWNQGSLWKKDRQPGWSDLEYQMRNWYYFAWMCGDHIVEQHIHNIDVVNWAKRAHPVRAVGMGGRQARTGPEYGHIYDHFTIDFEYEDGSHMLSMCRQIDNTEKNVSEALVGTKGQCQTADRNRYIITGESAFRFPRDKDNEPYVQEHIDLIASIRSGKPYNELKDVAESTLSAIMGRMSAYTGKAVTWDQALNSKEELMPAKLAFGEKLPTPAVAIPGQTQLV